MAAILGEHGGILGWRELAAALLARRGSELSDPAERLNVAAICVRAAVDTEEHLDAPRMLSRKADASGRAVLVALTEDAEGGGRSPSPRTCSPTPSCSASRPTSLPRRDPLPGVTEIRQALREVDHRRPCDAAVRHRPGAARRRGVRDGRRESAPGAVSPRPVTRPRAEDLPGGQPLRRPASDAELVSRVLARFPDLADPPRAEHMRDLLKASATR